MKAFLDHYGWRWMIHRPDPGMFKKQAVVITTAAGAGMKSAAKDVEDSLFYWGIARTYRFGIATNADSYENMSEKKKRRPNGNWIKSPGRLIRESGPCVRENAAFLPVLPPLSAPEDAGK